MAILELQVKVLEGTTKEGKKFNHYKAIQKNGTLIDLKFRKEVSPLPKVNSTIYVNDTDINKDTNRLYPCLWVKNILKMKAYEVKPKVDNELLDMFTVVEKKATNNPTQPVDPNSDIELDEDDLPF